MKPKAGNQITWITFHRFEDYQYISKREHWYIKLMNEFEDFGSNLRYKSYL